MRAAKVQASLRIRTVSPEPSLLAHTSSESRGTSRQKARSLSPLNGWACAVEICHDGMLEDTNSLDGVQLCIATHTIYTIIYKYTNTKYNKQFSKVLEKANMGPVKRICVFEHSVMTNIIYYIRYLIYFCILDI